MLRRSSVRASCWEIRGVLCHAADAEVKTQGGQKVYIAPAMSRKYPMREAGDIVLCRGRWREPVVVNGMVVFSIAGTLLWSTEYKKDEILNSRFNALQPDYYQDLPRTLYYDTIKGVFTVCHARFMQIKFSSSTFRCSAEATT